MENMTIKLVKEHEAQLKKPEIQAELKAAQDMINRLPNQLTAPTVYLVFGGGTYRDFEKKMTSVLIFLNNTGKTLKAFRAVIRLKSQIPGVQIAKATMEFDHDFLGDLAPQEGVLVHLNIPVKGLNEDYEFAANEITGEVSDVEIVYLPIEES
ncbi:MAG: hypothetical protein IJ040_05295 [Lachnospiraceae bacterium]|nr:hypothetical protein [Lachnospiraceae bacterium]